MNKDLCLHLINIYPAVRANYFAVVDQAVQSIYIIYIYVVHGIVEGCSPNLY